MKMITLKKYTLALAKAMLFNTDSAVGFCGGAVVRNIKSNAVIDMPFNNTIAIVGSNTRKNIAMAKVAVGYVSYKSALRLLTFVLTFMLLATGSAKAQTEQTLDFEKYTTGALADYNVKLITAGEQHTLILTTDNILYAFGKNRYGQLGSGISGTGESSNIPVLVKDGGGFVNDGSDPIVAMAAGHEHSVIVTASGKIYTFGYNGYGQLGNGTTGSSSIPVAVSSGDGFTNNGVGFDNKVVSVGAGNRHTVFATASGKVFTFGSNQYGQMGRPATTTSSSIPDFISSGSGFLNGYAKAVAAGDDHTIVISESGKVYAFGRNDYGQLGDGTTGNSSIPVAVSSGGGFANDGSDPVKAAAGGALSTIILTESGKVYTFGFNSHGQLGDGTTGNSSIPVAVSSGGGFVNDGSDPVISISGMGNNTGGHYIIATTSGKVYTIGKNFYGSLGNGTTTASSIPVAVSPDSGFLNDGSDPVIGTAAGWFHSGVVTESGKAYTWGYNYNGQLGVGSNTDRLKPANNTLQVAFSLTGTAPVHSNQEATNYTSDVLLNSVLSGNTIELEKDGGGYQTVTLSGGEYTIGNTAPFVVNDGETASFTIKVASAVGEFIEYPFTIEKASPLPTEYTFGADQTICEGNTATLTLNNSEAGVTYQLYNNATNVAVGSSVAGTGTAINFSVTPIETTTYYVIATLESSDLRFTDEITVTVSPISVGGSLIPSSATVTSGSNSTALTLSGQVGDVVRWESSATGDFASKTDISNTATNYTATNLTATTYYRAVVQSGVCGEAYSAVSAITFAAEPIPSSPFITTWETTTAGETITVPTTGGGYDFTIDWGDGTIENLSGGGRLAILMPKQVSILLKLAEHFLAYFSEGVAKDSK